MKYWTNPSVELINLSGDPLSDFIDRTRKVIFDAIQKGWSGPPFDPLKLADILRLQVIPSENVLDARTVPAPNGKVRIEFNPNRPIARVRYSLAHEIAHTLFPDCREYVRERQIKNISTSDEWQLEMLCNVSASEFLMPIGSFPDLREKPLNIEDMTNLREKYQVSTEAILLRSVKLTDLPCFVFCCSKHKEEEYGRYEIDYAIPSKSFKNRFFSGTIIPKGSNVENCTAIGFTAKGEEIWPRTIGKIHVECIGLPPYPGHRFPRVAGIGSLHKIENIESIKINYVIGDATQPRGEGNKIIAFIINDKGQSWGAGFANAIQKKWPFILDEFQHWVEHKRSEFTLGNNHISKLDSRLTVVKMISQHGYGESSVPRIRYGALETCLKNLAEEAITQKASVHMPRIGCGEAGGSWWIISELIEDILLKKGIDVTIYDLPKAGLKKRTCQLSFLESGG